MKHYAVFLRILDLEKSRIYRPEHLSFLDRKRTEGNIFANGRFLDGSGGLVIYRADSEEEVLAFLREDPYIVHGARTYEIHEWEIVKEEDI